MIGALWPVALACGLFALHPLRVESVAWVSERKDVLSAFLGLLTLLLYLRWVERTTRRGAIGVAATFAAALLAKPMLVTLPALMLLLDFWPLGRTSLAPPAKSDLPARTPVPILKLVREKIPLLLLSLASGVVTIFAQHARGAVRSMEEVPLSLRLANTPVAYARYLLKTIWPVDLTVEYPIPPAWPAWQVAGSAVLLLTITVLALARLRSRPWLAVGWLWFVGSLVPVIGLVQVGGQSMADRYSYLPSMGLGILLAWSVPARFVASKGGRGLIAGAAVAVLLALATLTSFQVAVWRDTRALFANALQHYPNHLPAHIILGELDESQDRFEDAAHHANAAIALRSLDVRPRVTLGVVLARTGRPESALPVLQEAVSLDPASANARGALGSVLARMGNTDEAIAQWERAIAINPDHLQSLRGLATALAARGDDRAAANYFARALDTLATLHPDVKPDAELLLAAGRSYARVGRHDLAISSFQRALELNPAFAAAHNALAIELAAVNDLPAALHHFAEAVRLEPGNAAFRGNLERAKAMGGR